MLNVFNSLFKPKQIPLNMCDIRIGKLDGFVVGNDGWQSDDLYVSSKEALRMNNEVWDELFQAENMEYYPPTLRLYGARELPYITYKIVSPFYTHNDREVMIPSGFFESEGIYNNIIKAAIIAHEVGHHIQSLTGGMTSNRKTLSEELLLHDTSIKHKNRRSITQELRADYLAGVWCKHAHNKWTIMEEGDLEKLLSTFESFGDDRMYMRASMPVKPENFTHGSSQQRRNSFHRGFKSGVPFLK